MPNANELDRATLLQSLIAIRNSFDVLIAEVGNGDALKATKSQRVKATKPSEKLDFSTPLRAFIKIHSQGMSGSEKFALLVAYLARGDVTKDIQLGEIESNWSRMTSKALLGIKFNRAFPTRARENDWVDATKHGAYRLRPNWTAILK